LTWSWIWVGTLLNRLFGTTFDVMDETKRQQTTKGEYCYVICCCIVFNLFGCGRYLDVPREGYERYGHGRGRHRRSRTRRRPGPLPELPTKPYILTTNPHKQDFERKSALFSLASSEILIVNLWEHQVGLYQGANMGLLKTVFEVNLGLFGKKGVDGCVFLPPSH
jgi:hypothetical protein